MILRFLSLLSLFLGLPALATPPMKYIMYLTGQHNVVPPPAVVSDVTHVILAFMRSSTFTAANQTSWPLFTTVNEVRSKFAPGTKVMVAIGGWGDSEGFEQAVKSPETRDMFATNVKNMLESTGADGVDIDWEYPGGNGASYKLSPNPLHAHEIPAYPLLLAAIRSAIGPALLSAAVPGLERDMLAFTPATLPQIASAVDFLNVMTYDLVNRRDVVAAHHAGLKASREAVRLYYERGIGTGKVNLGLAFYVKWFRVEAGCKGLGCNTVLMEDPNTGEDLGMAGAFSWHDAVPAELAASFKKAIKGGVWDAEGGGMYFVDEEEDLFWSWESTRALREKVRLAREMGLGGVFAWGLGEDAPLFEHFAAASEVVNGKTEKSEL